MSDAPTIARIDSGTYRVEESGRTHVVHVARTGNEVWIHWNGRVFLHSLADERSSAGRRHTGDAHQSLSAPMPATVLKVLVTTGATVRKGDSLVILEAMKMELPIRATADATVAAVHCHEGELVQPGAVLVELE